MTMEKCNTPSKKMCLLLWGSLPVLFKNKDDLVLTGVLGWSGDAILRGINSYNG
jgi:hypothetical protein